MVACGKKPCKAVFQNKMPILREVGRGAIGVGDFFERTILLVPQGRPSGRWRWWMISWRNGSTPATIA
jgi:hypothetical protein